MFALFQLVPRCTFDEEMQLFESMIANCVFIFPGSYFSCTEPGWFRIIFAMETDVLQKGKLTH